MKPDWHNNYPLNTFSGTTKEELLECIEELLAEERPIGVSQWRNLGKKMGWWKYFVDEERSKILYKVDNLIVKGLNKFANTPLSERKNAWIEIVSIRKEINKLNQSK